MFWITHYQKKLMLAIAQGDTLKSHRDLDGGKVYKLWRPSEREEAPVLVTEVPYRTVQRLLDRKLLTTNQKFPAATFLLTNKGQQKVKQWQSSLRGVGAVVHFDTEF